LPGHRGGDFASVAKPGEIAASVAGAWEIPVSLSKE